MYTFTEYLALHDDIKDKGFLESFLGYSRYVTEHCKNRRINQPTLMAIDLRDEYTAIKGSGSATEAADLTASKMIETSLRTILSSHQRHHDSLGSSTSQVHERSAEKSQKANHSDQADEPKDVDDVGAATPNEKGNKRKRSVPVSVDCWHDLYLAFTKLYSGDGRVIIPAVPSNLSPNRQALFRLARDRMTSYQTMVKKDLILLKDAQVAMSCLVNLICPSTYQYFENEFLIKAYDVCMDASFDQHQQVISWLSKYRDLMDATGDPSVVRDEALIDRGDIAAQRRKLGITTRSLHEKVLEVVEQVCNLVTERPFGDVGALSENDCLNAWTNIFQTLIPQGLTLHTGETSLNSTKSVQHELMDEYHDEGSETGRRVDLRFCYGSIEIANLGLKSPTQRGTARAKQNRKNLRLGRRIQMNLERLGVSSPQILCGDIAGFMGIFTQIVKVDDVFVANKITEHVATLPTTKASLKNFLDGSTLSCILNFLDRTEKLGIRAEEAAEGYQAQENEAEFVEDLEYDQIPEHNFSKSFDQTVISTPKKKQKQHAGLRAEYRGPDRTSQIADEIASAMVRRSMEAMQQQHNRFHRQTDGPEN
ncbi:hypothetical protein B0O80DRAFT_453663 [Mortierella sp. GBAus27b]|nr:hypothetical protein BGX31_010716 [Mortierella sp. GBA43]KAI8352685.1 hypothetical protein B0O80DRAFT_453663 [Mortierella sp. GBAus27b]